MEKIRVVMADFDEELCRALAEELEQQEDIHIAAITGQADQVLPLIRQTEAQVLVMEMALRGGDGLEVLEAVRGELGDRVKVLACSLFGDRGLVTGAVQRGADYFMIKPIAPMALAEHIRLAAGEQMGIPAEESLRYRAGRLLWNLGLQPNIKGYHYLTDALVIALEDPEAVCGITKVVYPQIARRHRTSAGAVERTIRHAVGRVWVEGNLAQLCRLFPHQAREGRCPSNSVFVAVLSQQLAGRERMWG
ncbi:MAG: response regulator [Oscillospiraceae bacterium]|nr:response regulator [Oscillospiraceae bacterium]